MNPLEIEDIKWKLFVEMPYESLYYLCRTNKSYLKYCQSSKLWMARGEYQFEEEWLNNKLENDTWHDFYLYLYIKSVISGLSIELFKYVESSLEGILHFISVLSTDKISLDLFKWFFSLGA